jgi:hypothetical protein
VAVYIFERIEIEGGGRGKLLELIRGDWARHAEERFGVRLAGLWATVGSTGRWPEADLLWEMEDWAHFAEAQQSQFPREDKDAFGTELWYQALAYRERGHASLLVPAPCSPPPRGAPEPAIPGELLLCESVRSKPGALGSYHDALGKEYLPVAEARGLRLFGAYRHALRPNQGMNLWALRGFEHWRELMEGEGSDPGARRWLDRCAELLEDLDAVLLAAPPQGRLRT